MGIQNCSITVYGLLLPGLTNLTGRLRYYSFYCWLLYEYTKEYRSSKRERSVRDQYNYIRRAELAMAFLMKDKEVNSVVGSLHISNRLYSEKQGKYDLKSSADIDYNPEHEKYWKYSTGAFGQYYLGSLVYLDLIDVHEDSFNVLERGEKLAKAYTESVSEKTRSLFLSCIREGYLPKNDVEKLGEMCLDKIIVESPEWKMLNGIIVNKDVSGLSFRYDSIYLMLETLKKKVEVRRFPCTMFLKHKEYDSEAVLGWHYYYLCEALHYCIEAIFWMVLSNASKQNYCRVDTFLDICQNSILKEENDLSGFANNQLSEILSVYDTKIDVRLESLVKIVKTGDFELAAYKAIELLLCLYNQVSASKGLYQKFEHDYGINQQFGYLTGFIKRYVENNQNIEISKFVRNIVRLVMADHTTSACRKMGRGQADLRKFLLEDGMIVLVEIWKPQFTNPRTDSLVAFLEDLSYVKDGRLTKIGEQLIVEYEKQ